MVDACFPVPTRRSLKEARKLSLLLILFMSWQCWAHVIKLMNVISFKVEALFLIMKVATCPDVNTPDHTKWVLFLIVYILRVWTGLITGQATGHRRLCYSHTYGETYRMLFGCNCTQSYRSLHIKDTLQDTIVRQFTCFGLFSIVNLILSKLPY